tara:strand:+ start:143 stop:616 length:474 start_codon:yes stop_codon:yes gene_type:complete
MTTLPPIYNIADPPSTILKAYLIDAGVGVDPTSSTDDWGIYVSMMPDAEGINDNAMAIMDTTGIKIAKWMKNGQTFFNYGFQILIRSNGYIEGFTQMKLVENKLDSVKYTSQVYNSITYRLAGVNRTSGFVLGTEDEKRRRQLFTVNGLLSVIDSNV